SSRGRSRRRQKVRCTSCDDHAASRCLSLPPAKLSLIGQDFHSVGLYGDDEDSPPLEFCGSPVSSEPAQTAAPSRLPVPESPTRQLNRLSAQAASAVEQLISICSLPSNGQSSSVIVGLLCRSLYSLVSNGLAMSSAWSTAEFVNQFGGNVSKARTVQQRNLLLKKSRLMASPLCLLVEESCASCVFLTGSSWCKSSNIGNMPIGAATTGLCRRLKLSSGKAPVLLLENFDRFLPVGCRGQNLPPRWGQTE
uniref:RUN domain-containing protein n=1 Tax=Macrostomum lignano TaxID=282301 RepID=A0A1I8FM78_9PLAT